jgi:adenosylhomocysteinase
MTIQNYHYIETLPLLKWVVNKWSKKKEPLQKVRILLIIHLLHDASGFLHALKLLGAKEVLIIGKPYSTVSQTVNEIKDLGFNQVFTPIDMMEFEKIVKDKLELILGNKEGNKDKVIILEDGGYCLNLIYLKNLNTQNLLGIVEQTTIGIRRNEKVIDKIQENGGNINYPIINVAETPSKKELESLEVGSTIVRNVETLLAKMENTIRGKEILVVGFGSIGSSVASIIKDKSHVNVYDNDPLRRIKAKYLGYKVCSLDQGIRTAQVVIGCSGNTWATADKLTKLKNNVIFVCATSERVEYSHEFLEKSSTQKKYNWGLEFNLEGKKINLLADGYPINFYGASAKESVPTTSVPGESFQIISSLLLWGMLFVRFKNKKQKGIVPFPTKEENDIDKKFEQILIDG